MSQNTSHAVMQQRSEAHDSLDDFPTPPWATRALLEHVLPTASALMWIPPCRRQLERESDWPVKVEAA